MTVDPRLHSPAAERNREPILAVLQRVLPERGVALEIASGSGQHAAHFAASLPGWFWWPTETQARVLPSISAWCAGLGNVAAPQLLDVLASHWPGAPDRVDAVFCANLLHIAPWSTCAALMQGAARHLAPQGRLLIYGPFFVDGEDAAPGNLAFDADLRARDPAWGVRRLAAVLAEALAAGLVLQERVAMPANNLMLVFAHAGAALATINAGVTAATTSG
jgi:SAM-dependent methyltransferase